MNFTIIRALLEDSRQQVLDNKIFRLLILLTGIPILVTFVIGFHDDHMDVLFGMYRLDYTSIPPVFGGGADASGADLIASFQGWVVGTLAGNLGIMFCVAATAFFMPRILEKGAADTLFSKPVSRLAILSSRYFAGLLFIAGISLFLVTGMFFGLGIRSGHWDAGFLWSTVTLVYLFGMMHAFSLFIAVLTRSSTAAILITIVLYVFTGGIHIAWKSIEHAKVTSSAELMRATQQGDQDEDSQGEDDDAGRVLTFVLKTVSALHYTLPKTHDADIISDKLRRSLTERGPDVTSDDSELIIKRGPKDYRFESESEGELEGTGVRWHSTTPGGADDGLVIVKRYERPEEVRGVGKKKRTVPQNGRSAAKALEEELTEGPDTIAKDSIDSSSQAYGGVRMYSVRWVEQVDEQSKAHTRAFFHFGEWMCQIDFIEDPDLHVNENRRRWVKNEFLDPINMTVGNEFSLTQPQWYAREFGWTSPWRFNIFFSIGSSLAFILAMLGLAWLRLRRIDF